jgi:hypothetical protein
MSSNTQNVIIIVIVIACNYLFVSSLYCRHSMTANVLQLPEGGDFEALTFSLAQMPNRSTNVQFSTEAQLLQNPCYAFVVSYSSL